MWCICSMVLCVYYVWCGMCLWGMVCMCGMVCVCMGVWCICTMLYGGGMVYIGVRCVSVWYGVCVSGVVCSACVMFGVRVISGIYVNYVYVCVVGYVCSIFSACVCVCGGVWCGGMCECGMWVCLCVYCF